MKAIRTAMISLLILAVAAPAMAAARVGTVLNVRGQAYIERETRTFTAKPRSAVQQTDVIATKSRSRAKVLMRDNSILSVSSNSRLSIAEYKFGDRDSGKSVVNLIEGRMRTVVGRTRFEVHTPTTVAAARGTVIEFTTGMSEGKPFTVITCLEGTVSVKSIDSAIAGEVLVRAGQTVKVFKDAPIPQPGKASVAKSVSEAKKAKEEESAKEEEAPAEEETVAEEEAPAEEETAATEESLPVPEEDMAQEAPAVEEAPVIEPVAEGPVAGTREILPPIAQEPALLTTPVTLNILFP